MSDIVDRLRALPPSEICEHGSQVKKCLVCENQRLDAEIERLRAAVREICDLPPAMGGTASSAQRIAREALSDD